MRNFRGGFIVALAFALVFSSACRKSSPTSPGTVPIPGNPGNISQIVSFTGSTPGAGAELSGGTQISLSMSAKGFTTGTLYYGFVFIREDGMEKPFGCSMSSSGSNATGDLGMTIPMADGFWAPGHTVDAALVANYSSGTTSSGGRPVCEFQSGEFPNTRIDWEKVQYRSDVHLNWHVAGQIESQELLARDDTYSMPRGGILTIQAPGVLGNDVYPASLGASTLFSGPPGGLNLQDLGGTGGFRVDMSVNPNFTGQTWFRYQLRSQGRPSNWATVTINVQ